MERLTQESIGDSILAAESVETLRTMRDQWNESLRDSFRTASPPEWNESVNLAHDGFIRQTIALTEREMVSSGAGAPPQPYAFVLFGSGGRREQTLWSDQDNGVIVQDGEEDEEQPTGTYFAELSRRISANLRKVGYPPCDGNVLCTNPLWRKPLRDWKRTMDEWFAEPNWENVRYLLILADFRAVYGESSLWSALRDRYEAFLRDHPEFFSHLVNNTLHHKVSINLFGQLVTERYGEDAGGIDIKYGAYIPMVNGVRLLALQSGIRESSTAGRLARLREAGNDPAPLLEACEEAFAGVLRFRSMTPYQLEDGQYASRGFLPLDGLAREDRQQLKRILRTGMELQKYVKKKIGQTVRKTSIDVSQR